MEKDLISVIVPIYNVEDYIEECIESIIHQTYTNLQVLLVDDGSPDNCPKICDEYAEKDNRISVIHKMNGGLADARNVGIQHAEGKYISFIDSDDYFEPEMIEKLHEACLRNNADIGVCGRRLFNSAGIRTIAFNVNTMTEYAPSDAIEQILLNNNMDSAAWDKLYKADLFKTIRYPYGFLHEDLSVTCRLFDLSNKVIHISYVGYNYRIREGSITKSGFTSKKMDLFYQALELSNFVNDKYPHLNKQAEKFMCFTITNLITLLLKTDKNKFQEEREIINNLGYEYLLKNIFNRYLSIKDKCRMLIKLLGLR